ncbi:hypothetical protein HG536_0F00940 [Torulaspora globosa]|uniref:Glycosyltransferase family 15 protein n=1 Tax=Torulaspora globosa TaxID=48254 RepID=A0A7G3ZJT3_9SACH|nr:uncharacterized protein HG536_0F00940 [Torulaspora globosa]QLL33769.1 hypothetical protein HG536_0F00940 [Torulaspora globosa]
MKDKTIQLAIVLLTVLGGLFIQSLFTTAQHCNNRYKIENAFFENSKHAVEKYDGIRRRSLLKPLKLSTNTYDDDVLSAGNSIIPTKENATLLMLVRNFELSGALKSMRSLEDRFNRDYHYDWVFLNDLPFTQEFMEATTAMASGNTHYALIPSEDWDRPNWIDEQLFEDRLELLRDRGVLYGGSKSYRNMCRFNSGYFFRQKILDSYDYYFRVEPDVEYFCDFPYDPFKLMRHNKKKYGFVISLYEYEDTITTLWDTVEEYLDTFPDDVAMVNNSYNFITDSGIIGKFSPIIDSNTDYNLCHFWSNFEIGDLNFFRSDRYKRFFDFLDSKGGFHYERWGDAPVHSIAVSLLLNRDEIIHFDELGYFHAPFSTCPTSYYLRLQQRCQCDAQAASNIDISPNSCLMRWWKNGDGKRFLKDNQTN